MSGTLIKNKIYQLIDENRITEALKFLAENNKKPRYKRAITLIRSDWNALQQGKIAGSISNDLLNERRSQINERILELVDQILKEPIPPEPIPPLPKPKPTPFWSRIWTKLQKIIQFFTRHRKPILIGLIILSGGFVGGGLIWTFMKHNASIYFCAFDDRTPEDQHLRITLLPFQSESSVPDKEDGYRQQLLDRLLDKRENENLTFQIGVCDSSLRITSFFQALLFGKELNTDLIVWGNYKTLDDQDQSKQVNIHYALVSDKYIDQSKSSGSTGEQPLQTLGHLREGYLQKDIDFVIYWLQGLAAYDQDDLKTADIWFKRAMETNSDTDEFSHETLTLLGTIFNNLGEYAHGLTYHQEALDAYTSSTSEYDQDDLGEIYNNIAISYRNLNQNDSAFAYFEHTLALLEDNPINYAIALNNTATVINGYFDNHNRALTYLGNALNILNTDEGEGISYQRRELLKATCYNNIASVYRDAGACDRALENQEKTEEIYHAQLEDQGHSDFAALYNNLAVIKGCLGDHESAVDYHERAVEIQETKLPADHPSRRRSYKNAAIASLEAGQEEKAIHYFKKHLAIRDKQPEMVDKDILSSLQQLADLLGKVGQAEEAESYLSDVESVQQQLGLTDPHENLRLAADKAYRAYNKEAYEQAILHYSEYLSLDDALSSPDQNLWANCIDGLYSSYNNWAVQLTNSDSTDEAISLLTQGIAQLSSELSPRDSSVMELRQLLIQCYNNQGINNSNAENYPLAIEYFDRGIQAWEAYAQPGDNTLTEFRKGKALANRGLGIKAETMDTALPFYQEAERILLKVGGETTESDLADLYRDMGVGFGNEKQWEQARSYLQKSLAIYTRLNDEEGQAKVQEFLGQISQS
ncbi:MAG: tetratricopeptide repeat protein [Bacteroidota bacterium]